MHLRRPKFAVEVLKAGAFGYVLKDHAFEELVAAIRAVQDHKTYISQALFNIVTQDYVDFLRYSETRLRTIFEGTSIGIALVNKDGWILESNHALQEFLGSNKDDLCQQKFTEFLQPQEVTECCDLFNNLVEVIGWKGNIG